MSRQAGNVVSRLPFLYLQRYAICQIELLCNQENKANPLVFK